MTACVSAHRTATSCYCRRFSLASHSGALQAFGAHLEETSVSQAAQRVFDCHRIYFSFGGRLAVEGANERARNSTRNRLEPVSDVRWGETKRLGPRQCTCVRVREHVTMTEEELPGDQLTTHPLVRQRHIGKNPYAS